MTTVVAEKPSKSVGCLTTFDSYSHSPHYFVDIIGRARNGLCPVSVVNLRSRFALIPALQIGYQSIECLLFELRPVVDLPHAVPVPLAVAGTIEIDRSLCLPRTSSYDSCLPWSSLANYVPLCIKGKACTSRSFRACAMPNKVNIIYSRQSVSHDCSRNAFKPSKC